MRRGAASTNRTEKKQRDAVTTQPTFEGENCDVPDTDKLDQLNIINYPNQHTPGTCESKSKSNNRDAVLVVSCHVIRHLMP